MDLCEFDDELTSKPSLCRNFDGMNASIAMVQLPTVLSLLLGLLLVGSCRGFVPVVQPAAPDGSRIAKSTVHDAMRATAFAEYETRNDFPAFETRNDFPVYDARNDFAAWQMTSWETGIFEAEMNLKQAMLHSDVLLLDRLLDDNLRFVNHLDQVITKADDLDAHRMRIVAIDSITLSSWNVEAIQGKDGRPDLAQVTVDAHIIGSLNGFFFEDTLRFNRVWKRKAGGRWQVVKGDSSILIMD